MSLVLVLSAALLAQTPAGAGAAAWREQASVAGEVVRLGDVADLSGLPAGLRDKAGALTIARFRPGQTEMSIRPERLAEKARALMPALASRLPADVARPIKVRRAAATTNAEAAGCLIAGRDMAAGEALVRDEFSAGPCDDPLPGALRYDPGQRVARLSRTLKAGDSIAAPPASVFAGVRAGQPLVLAMTVGPVTVERQVTAVRSSAPGQPVFVRGDTGPVFSAPAPGEAR